jgi:hypothetical protein
MKVRQPGGGPGCGEITKTKTQPNPTVPTTQDDAEALRAAIQRLLLLGLIVGSACGIAAGLCLCWWTCRP